MVAIGVGGARCSRCYVRNGLGIKISKLIGIKSGKTFWMDSIKM
jgi:hypothetical protein